MIIGIMSPKKIIYIIGTVANNSKLAYFVFYTFYSFKVLPLMGKVIAKDADSYQYLAESIRMHPDQATLKAMMEQAGFERCSYHNMSGGIVALHKGFKL